MGAGRHNLSCPVKNIERGNAFFLHAFIASLKSIQINVYHQNTHRLIVNGIVDNTNQGNTGFRTALGENPVSV